MKTGILELMLKLGESSLSIDRGCGSLIYLLSYRGKIERTIGEAWDRYPLLSLP